MVDLSFTLRWVDYLSLLDHLDEKTTNPASYKGNIGANIQTYVYTLPFVIYKPFCGNIQNITTEVAQQLRTDQQYLYKFCLVVKSGPCDLNGQLHLILMNLSGLWNF